MKFLAAYIMAVCCTLAGIAYLRATGVDASAWTVIGAGVSSGAMYLIFKAAVN